MRKLCRSAFTFLEIMLVVTIIGIILGIAGPRIVGKAKKAKINACKASMSGIKTALLTYEMTVGDFPTTSQGIKALVVKPSDVDEADWDRQMDTVPTDPWRQVFVYRYPSEHGMDFDLSSKGPDRSEGTEDDINNWDDLGVSQ